MACGKEDQPSQETIPIAHYPFSSNFEDATGQNAAANQENVVFQDQSIYMDGNYLWDDDSGSVLWIPEIKQWNLADFRLTLEFKLASIPTNQQPILVLGNQKRWALIDITSSGQMNLAFHDTPRAVNLSTDKFSTGTWYQMEVKYSAVERTFQLWIDQTLIYTETDLDINHQNDRSLAAHHAGNGVMFHGNWRQLKVY